MSDYQIKQFFSTPPSGYGTVPFYWWVGDPLDRDKLLYHLDQVKDHHISGLQVNYCHTDRGGLIYGLTMRNEPDLFSDAWWELFGWFMQEAKKRGIAVSLSDYTLGIPGQGYFTDWILEEHPDMTGCMLQIHSMEMKAGIPAEINLSGLCACEDLLCAVFLHRQEKAADLLRELSSGIFTYCPDRDGELVLVYRVRKEKSLDPMHPEAGNQVIAKFFHPFEEHFPGECGKGLNFFFSDELEFRIRGNLWNDFFAEEFQRRKGYDIRPVLYQLFRQADQGFIKTRLDYYDVIVQLEEENYFQKVYRWHEERGMVYGCDHGGRGKDVTEFGDYFRTQKYNQGPGCDQPMLESDIIKNKVASSIAHLYQRPRVWLEGFHSSGWGTSSQDLADALARNFVMGHTLLSLHGFYYSTHGSWWEWAPPCNCVRVPYWKDMKQLLAAVERMSYLLSQGVHCAPVAILYPVAAMEGGIEGEVAVETAFSMGESLYSSGIDLDYLDFESLRRAEIAGGALQIAGESYSVVVIPNMRTIRGETIQKLCAFAQAGGKVICVGDFPIFSDLALEGLEEEFRLAGGIIVPPEEAVNRIRSLVQADIVPEQTAEYYTLHRRIDGMDVFMSYGIPKGTRCLYRAFGKPSFWNCQDGKSYALKGEPCPEGTYITMPVWDTEFPIIVFSEEAAEEEFQSLEPVEEIPLEDDVWEFEVKPSLDNRWGDFELPVQEPVVGVLVKEFEDLGMVGEPVPSAVPCERSVRSSFGPYYLAAGPFQTQEQWQQTAERAAQGITEGFAPYEMSMRYGLEQEPGHQGYHGLKGKVTDAYLTVGRLESKRSHMDPQYKPYEEGVGRVFYTTVLSDRDQDAYLLTDSMKPDRLYVNGIEYKGDCHSIPLKKGRNPVVAAYLDCGRTYLLFATSPEAALQPTPYPLAMRWYRNPHILPLDAFGGRYEGQYVHLRFDAPPATESMKLRAQGAVIAYIGGERANVMSDGESQRILIESPKPDATEVHLFIRVEKGHYAGAALEEAVAVTCGVGRIHEGDWSRISGLKAYSGGAWYRKTVHLDSGSQEVLLDLGEVVSSASVYVNGQYAGTRVAAPWTFSIGPWLQKGDNRLEIEVYNTLGNQFEFTPTPYKTGIRSGLLGKVKLWIAEERP